MTLRIRCPHCGAHTNVTDQEVGKVALCGTCEQPIIISSEQAKSAPTQRPTREASQIFKPSEAKPELIIRDEQRRQRKLPTLGLMALFVVLGIGGWILLSLPRGVRNGHGGRSECRNNLKQIAIALHNYHDEHGTFPPAYLADENGKPMHSWRVLILPYIEGQHLYDQYDFNEPWDGPNNRRLADQMPETFACPADPAHGFGLTNYMVVVGDNTAFPGDRGVGISEITDGMASTIMVVEVASSRTNWMEPKDLDVRSLLLQVNATRDGRYISSHHQDGANVAMADASVHFLGNGTPSETIPRLLHRRDGYWAGEFD